MKKQGKSFQLLKEAVHYKWLPVFLTLVLVVGFLPIGVSAEYPWQDAEDAVTTQQDANADSGNDAGAGGSSTDGAGAGTGAAGSSDAGADGAGTDSSASTGAASASADNAAGPADNATSTADGAAATEQDQAAAQEDSQNDALSAQEGDSPDALAASSLPLLKRSASLKAAAASTFIDEPVNYLGLDDVTYRHMDTIKVESSSTTWGEDGYASWYAVTENVTISGRITCKGDVTLILADGATLTASGGITVPQDRSGSLTIYGQVEQTGTLSSGVDNKNHASIGGVGTETIGAITINGGKVEASNVGNGTNFGGAAIGAAMTDSGGSGGKVSSIVINKGEVTAKGYRDGVAIGTVADSPDGRIVINGGKVTAQGGGSGTGIGGAKNGYIGHIIINDGEVVAASAMQSTYGATGIGCGCDEGGRTFGDILITGGTVTATGCNGTSASGAGIGGGKKTVTGTVTTGGTVTITGGTVSASSNGYVGIGGGSGATVNISGGKVTANATVADNGTVTAIGSGPGIQAENINLSWTDDTYDNAEVTASSYSTELTLEKPWVVRESKVTASMTSAALKTIVPDDYIPIVDQPVAYLDANGDEQMCEDYTNLSIALAESYTLEAGWYVVDRDLNISERIICSGDVHLILKDGTTLAAVQGIQVQKDGPTGTITGTLTIYGQSEKTDQCGTLEVTKPPLGSAGIGDYEPNNGNWVGTTSGLITINGGHVKSTGSGNGTIGKTTYYGAAAIGGGDNGYGDVVINGGYVEATAPAHAAAIGNGYQGYNSILGEVKGQVTINGGTVVATASTNGAAIGGGNRGAIRTIRITGGTVTAKTTGNGAAIGSGGAASYNAGGVDAKSESTIEILGGEVTATAVNGAAIGGANSASKTDGPGGNVKITGGTVTATSTQGAGIGGGGTNTEGKLSLGWQDGDASTGLPKITASSYHISDLELIDDNTFAKVDGASYVTVSLGLLQATSTESTIVPYVAPKEDVSYLDYNATTGQMEKANRTQGDYKKLSEVANITTAATTIGETGKTTWYVVDTDITAAARITCAGDVRLILENGTTLDATKGITVKGSDKLTIYEQSAAPGQAVGVLNAGQAGTIATDDAGIGGSGAGDVGTITINGGYITARGGTSTAGIGCGASGKSGTVQINGGTVYAYGGGSDDAGSGIGLSHGYKSDCSLGSITVNGGDVHAFGGGNRGSGIGGGYYSDGGSITINGGAVEAKGSSCASGIGGSVGASHQITITGGTVKAIGGAYGAGIGEGYRPYHSTLSISGGSVYAKGYNGIGGGSEPDPGASSTVGKIVITGGNVTAEATNANGHGIGDKATASIALLNISGGQVNAVGGASGKSIRVGTTTLGSDYPGTGLPYITAQTYADTVTLAVPFVEAGTSTAVTATDLTAGFAEPTSIYPQSTDVPYLDADGARQVRASDDYTNLSTLADDPLTLNEGWYVVDANITKSSRITVSGDVHLILTNATTLTASKGISVQSGNSLTVYAQSEDEGAMGKLTIDGTSVAGGDSAIGGSSGNASGSIEICGGGITAVAGNNGGAGIGGGSGKAAGSCTIHGGNVTATGTNGGAGIGGGQNAGNANGGTVTITGGTVVAYGYGLGAGIGGGWASAGGTIDISGGDVTATGDSGAAGIGGGGISSGSYGTGASGGKITISGGTVKAEANGYGAGIGGGAGEERGGSGGSIEIAGGTVNATSKRGFSIGNGNSPKALGGEGTGGKITLTTTDINSGYPRITATRYSGTVTLEVPFVKDGDTSTAISASNLTTGFAAATTIYPMAIAVPYLDANGATQYCTTYTNLSTVTDTTLAAGWYVVDKDITLASRIACSGDVHLILKDGTKLDATNGGVNVAAGNNLSIYAQTTSESVMGALNATSSATYAAIGGGDKQVCGVVTINGGHIEAKVNGVAEATYYHQAAGIGGGGNDAGLNAGGTVTINGGVVTARGAVRGAGIGGGGNSNGGTVTINGGTVKAYAGSHAAGIGGGCFRSGGTVTVNAGHVEAYSAGAREGIGGGYSAWGAGAGIGGGWGASGGNISVNGGYVLANGSNWGAGIGGGGNWDGGNSAHGVGGTISVMGGEVHAYAHNGAAIGGGGVAQTNAAGLGASGGNITISGGTVEAVSTNSAGIGGSRTLYSGSLTLKWQDGDAATGQPQITASSYQLSELATSSDSFIEKDDDEQTFVTKQILNGYTSQTTIIPFKTASGDVTYLDYVDGEMVTKIRAAGTYTELTADALASSDYKLTDGWYVTSAGTLLLDASDGSADNKELVTSGDVHLILKNDSKLNVRGVVVSAGNSFTAYQQPEATGEATGILNCLRNTSTSSSDSLRGGAAIGGGRADSDRDAGTLTINGGVINAIGDCSYSITSAQWGAGIGGGNDGKRGTITINGGTVTAKGNIYGAGIGGSVDPRKRPDAAGSGSVTINGGAVVATGGSFSAGIGGGVYEDGGTIVINGGDVEVTGGEGSNGGAAGIGGGQSASGGTILITGGRVKAYGHVNGAGIGGGGGGRWGDSYINFAPEDGGSITITGGEVEAYGAQWWPEDGDAKYGGGAGIGGGGSSRGDSAPGGDGGTITISGTAQVQAEGRQNGAGIGGGGSLKSVNGGAGDIKITGGTVTATSRESATFDIGPGTAGTDAAQTTDGTVYLTGEYNDDDALSTPHITASRYGGKVTFGKVFVSSTDTGTALSAAQLTSGFGAAVTIFPKNIVTPVSYLDYINGSMEERVCASYYKLSEVTDIDTAAVTIGTAGTTTWYVVDQDITAAERIACAGDVHLILVDGNTMTAVQGIRVQGEGGPSKYERGTLTIYAQSQRDGQCGTLEVTEPPAGAAGIGSQHSGITGGYAGMSGRITINGGNIVAAGGKTDDVFYGAAAIGGGEQGYGDVVINGGFVTATTENYGAGIGNGYQGSKPTEVAGKVVINGGVVQATGSSLGAGIGGGCRGSIESIVITGGAITAKGGTYGAGIGGGGSQSYSAGGSGMISITGGTVLASAENYGAGIGGGGSRDKNGGSGGSISITGGAVEARSVHGPGIGGGASAKADAGSGGVLTLDWSDANDPTNGEPRITCSSYGVSTLNYANADRAFALTSKPSVAKTTDEVKVLVNQTIVPVLAAVPYLDWNETTRTMEEKECSDYTLLSSYLEGAVVRTMFVDTKSGSQDRQVDYVKLASGWYVVEDTIDLKDKSYRLFVDGDVKFVMKNGSQLLAKYGINVDEGKTFTVYQQPEEDGKQVGCLKAGYESGYECKYHSAGIGGYDDYGNNISSKNGGTVVINGGEVYVRGGQHAAGIGGAADNGNNGSLTVNYGMLTAVGNQAGDGIGSGYGGVGSGTVTINGGKVTATGGSYGSNQTGAGISGALVTITGGEVTATGSTNGSTGAAGIGSRVDKSSKVVIEGGTVVATGGANAAGIGAGSGATSFSSVTIRGGNVTAKGGASTTGIGSGLGNSTSMVTLGWTSDTFASTEVTASAYKGSIKIERPYVWKSDGSTLAEWKSASDNNINANTIIPSLDLVPDFTMKEGRKYTAFADGATSVSLPANSAWTAQVDMAESFAVADEFGFTVRDLTATFGKQLPAGTTFTLAAIDKSGNTSRYYAVLGSPSTSVHLTDFASMERRGVLFAPSADDKTYLLGADFAEVGAAALAAGSDLANVDVGLQVGYAVGSGASASDRVSKGSYKRSFSLVALGKLSTATSGGVKVETQPTGSALLAGKKVYLVGQVAGADGASGGAAQPSLELTDISLKASSGGDIAGTWLASNVMVFDLGTYGSARTGTFTPSLDWLGQIAGAYNIEWTLYVGDDLRKGTVTWPWNVRGSLSGDARGVVQSNVVTSSVTASAADVARPELSIEAAGDHKYSRTISPSSGNYSFKVTANRNYTVTLEKQTALGAFTAVAGATGTGEKTASTKTVTIAAPADCGTYRLVFSMADTTTDDNVYYTLIVE